MRIEPHISLTEERTAGVVWPLFSVRTDDGWGVGEFRDFGRAAPLLVRAGFSMWMSLPLVEPTPGQESPYTTASAFALDPLYLCLPEVPEFAALGGEAALSEEERAALEEARGSKDVRHDLIRPLKMRWLRRSAALFFEQNKGFFERDPIDAEFDEGNSARAASFEQFCERNASWLERYALFRAIKSLHPGSWRSWPAALRDREPAALEEARQALGAEIRAQRYLQWVGLGQLEAARRAANEAGLWLVGDEPFLVADDSAEVWAERDLFRSDATVGAPPDEFSAEGQKWGLPPYDWEAMRERGYVYFRERGQHAARLFDAVRIDHVIGLYRTYCIPLEVPGKEPEKPYFVPKERPAQIEQGEAVLRAFAAGGCALLAEDLGVIPGWARESMWRMSLPGFRVMRWDKHLVRGEGGAPEQRYVDPRGWPHLSVAASGTHDTETLGQWWQGMSAAERKAAARLPYLEELTADQRGGFTEAVHGALLELLYASTSNLLLLPIQDLFGLLDRVNVPNTVGPHNWAFRMPWTVRALAEEPHTRSQLARLRALAERYERAPLAHE